MHIVALIPARKNSKGIPNKNIIDYNGEPLIVHSIKQALNCTLINDVIVSTDSDEISHISLTNNASVLFRPDSLAEDLTPDLPVFQHFLKHYDKYIDLIVHLRATYPNRTNELLEDCIKTFVLNMDKYDSLRTVTKTEKLPYKMYNIKDNNLIPLFQTYESINEPYNQCRQIFPDCYIHNGCIDIIKPYFIYNNSMSGKNIYPYIMNENYDIDTYADLIKSKK